MSGKMWHAVSEPGPQRSFVCPRCRAVFTLAVPVVVRSCFLECGACAGGKKEKEDGK